MSTKPAAAQLIITPPQTGIVNHTTSRRPNKFMGPPPRQLRVPRRYPAASAPGSAERSTHAFSQQGRANWAWTAVEMQTAFVAPLGLLQPTRKRPFDLFCRNSALSHHIQLPVPRGGAR